MLAKFSGVESERIMSKLLRVRFFTEIRDRIKNLDHKDFSLTKEAMFPQKDYFH